MSCSRWGVQILNNSQSRVLAVNILYTSALTQDPPKKKEKKKKKERMKEGRNEGKKGRVHLVNRVLSER